MPVEELPPRAIRRLPGDVARLGRYSMMSLPGFVVNQRCKGEENSKWLLKYRVGNEAGRWPNTSVLPGNVSGEMDLQGGEEYCVPTEHARMLMSYSFLRHLLRRLFIRGHQGLAQ